MSQSLYSLLQVNDPIVVELPDDRTDTYIRAIREQVKPSLQIVVVIFPSQRDDRYSSIKKLCCVENPVPSQVNMTVDITYTTLITVFTFTNVYIKSQHECLHNLVVRC